MRCCIPGFPQKYAKLVCFFQLTLRFTSILLPQLRKHTNVVNIQSEKVYRYIGDIMFYSDGRYCIRIAKSIPLHLNLYKIKQ